MAGKTRQNGLWKDEPSLNGTTKYEPLSSVWEGSDSELLEAMLSFYPTINPEPILDATYNTGRFWKGSPRDVWSMDIDPKYKTKIVGDNRIMKGIPSQAFGTVVYDPPHVGPQGRVMNDSYISRPTTIRFPDPA